MAHSDETKAMAIGLLLAGSRVNEIARTLKLPRQTVSHWNGHLGEILDKAFAEDGRYPSLPEIGKKMGVNRTELE